MPDDTILIENPIAVAATSEHPAEAKALVDYLRTDAAQKISAKNGYRPVQTDADPASQFPRPSGLFTIGDLGGWDSVTKEFFDPKGSVMAGVEQKLGVSVEKK